MTDQCNYFKVLPKYRGKYARRCTLAATVDGWCADHHPDEISRKRRESAALTAEVMAELAADRERLANG
jgi:hypothetical protein